MYPNDAALFLINNHELSVREVATKRYLRRQLIQLISLFRLWSVWPNYLDFTYSSNESYGDYAVLILLTVYRWLTMKTIHYRIDC